jgi:acetyl-CoA C-acetyltransferase
VARARIPVETIDEAIIGCVLSAGLGQAPARQAALAAGMPDATGCVTVNKMCGSGMKAIMLAHDALLAGSARTVVAGGMESMSNAPYLLDRARSGYRMGHRKVIDHMFFDGLEDAYERGRLMGSFAEDCATHYQFTRDMQDEFAIRSLTRAQDAVGDGSFASEVAPVTVKNGKAEQAVSIDELPVKAKASEISKLKPAFHETGTITAASSSAISDGAAALVLTSLEQAERHGLTPLAAISGHATHAAAPSQFSTAPIGAIKKLTERLAWPLKSIDLFEINEAFAVVVMAALRELDLPRDKVNIHGGACALGHPIGASGARIVVTLLATLEKYDLRRGVAALCIGGGEATAIAIERMH